MGDGNRILKFPLLHWLHNHRLRANGTGFAVEGASHFGSIGAGIAVRFDPSNNFVGLGWRSRQHRNIAVGRGKLDWQFANLISQDEWFRRPLTTACHWNEEQQEEGKAHASVQDGPPVVFLKDR